jgi:hypothetical protein
MRLIQFVALARNAMSIRKLFSKTWFRERGSAGRVMWVTALADHSHCEFDRATPI